MVIWLARKRKMVSFELCEQYRRFNDALFLIRNSSSEALVWDGIKLKVCNDHEFVRTTFNREEICCKLHLNKNCFDSFKMNDELEESCAVLNNYKAFLKVCLYRIGVVDFFDIIKPYLVKLSDGCRTNSKYPFVSLEGDD